MSVGWMYANCYFDLSLFVRCVGHPTSKHNHRRMQYPKFYVNAALVWNHFLLFFGIFMKQYETRHGMPAWSDWNVSCHCRLGRLAIKAVFCQYGTHPRWDQRRSKVFFACFAQ